MWVFKSDLKDETEFVKLPICVMPMIYVNLNKTSGCR